MRQSHPPFSVPPTGVAKSALPEEEDEDDADDDALPELPDGAGRGVATDGGKTVTTAALRLPAESATSTVSRPAFGPAVKRPVLASIAPPSAVVTAYV